MANGLSTADVEAITRQEFANAGVDPDLGVAIGKHESGLDPSAVNMTGGDGRRGGSYGHMQMSLATARGLGFAGPPSQLHDPHLNAMLAAKLVNQLASRFGNVRDVVSAYNSGQPFESAPDSTRTQYVPGVLSHLGYGPDVTNTPSESATATASRTAGFDPDSFLAQHGGAGFDPDSFLAAHAEKPGTGEAVLRGLGQGATLGYGDELSGFLEALGSKAFGPEHVGKTFGDLYRQYRDEARRNNQAAQDAHPIAYGAGDVGGSLASGLLLPVGAGVGGALKAGAAIGAASGLGTSNADLTQGNLRGAAVDTAEGAATGAAGGAIGAGIAKLGEPLEALGIAQGRRAIEGGRSPLAVKKKLSDDAVRAAFEHGGIMPFDSTATVAERLNGIREGLGQKYAGIINQLEANGVTGPNAHQLAMDLLGEAQASQQNSLLSPKPGLFRKVAKELESKPVDANGDLSLSGADQMKRTLQQEARAQYDKLNGTHTPVGDAKLGVASRMREAIEDSVANQSYKAPDVAAQFEPVKADLGNIISASNAADRGANAAASRRGISPTDYLASAAGFAGAGPHGLVAGLGNHVMRTRGTSAVAYAAYHTGTALQDLVQRNPAALGRYGAILANALYSGGQDAFAAHSYVLSQTDPDFQARLNELSKDSE